MQQNVSSIVLKVKIVFTKNISKEDRKNIEATTKNKNWFNKEDRKTMYQGNE